MEYIFETPEDYAKMIAARLKRVRKRRKITQKQLAADSGVTYAALRKFERTGQISLASMIRIALELGMRNDLDDIFTEPVYLSIEEAIRDDKAAYINSIRC